MSDIVDQIDELVDQSLASGPVDDYNADRYDRCPHCSRHWHGLAITERIDRMYRLGVYDENYSLDGDDSPVLCRGSNFIGPMPSQWGTRRPKITVEIGDGSPPWLHRWRELMTRGPRGHEADLMQLDEVYSIGFHSEGQISE